MNLFPAADGILVAEPELARCPSLALPPEGNVKLRNYRVLNENLRAYTPTGDVHTSPAKGKLVARYEVSATVAPPRARILELVRPEDPGREELEAIVRPAPRRGLVRPLDEDTRRFLQRALQSPSPYVSASATPEPRPREPEPKPEPAPEPVLAPDRQRSLAEELREAEARQAPAAEGRESAAAEGALGAAARRLDALLAESRALHAELAGIQQDLQVLARRVRRDP